MMIFNGKGSEINVANQLIETRFSDVFKTINKNEMNRMIQNGKKGTKSNGAKVQHLLWKTR